MRNPQYENRKYVSEPVYGLWGTARHHGTVDAQGSVAVCIKRRLAGRTVAASTAGVSLGVRGKKRNISQTVKFGER